MALAAVVALVVVLATGDDDGGTDVGSDREVASGSERGFDSPEEAVTFMVERLAAGEGGAAAEAFAVEPIVDGYSFETQAERLRAVQFSTWLPGSSDGYDEINADLRRGEVAVELRSLVRSILVPDREQTQTTIVGDNVTSEQLVDELAPESLADLAVARTDVVERIDEAYLETLERLAEVYDADELRSVGMLLDTADGQVMAGATVVRYDDQWSIMNLSAPILDLPIGEVVDASEDEYLDAVASANGSDD